MITSTGLSADLARTVIRDRVLQADARRLAHQARATTTPRTPHPRVGMHPSHAYRVVLMALTLIAIATGSTLTLVVLSAGAGHP